MARFICICWLVIFTCSAQAAWFEAQGQAPILNGDIDQARESGVKDAVRQALLYAGASIKSLQQLDNGVLAKQQLQLAGEGEIRGLKVTSERIENDFIYVSVQVDVLASEQPSCAQQQYAKSLALVRFKLRNREQAINGGIFHLDGEFTGKLNNLLNLNQSAFDVRQFINQNVNFNPNLLDSRHHAVREQVMVIASRADSQFVLMGSIDDVSVERDEKQPYDFFFKEAPRNFYLSTYLFDGLSGELLDVKHYRQRAMWTYKEQDIVDLSSKKFWDAPYGQSLLSVMDDVLINTTAALECVDTMAKIIAVHDEKVQINLGSKNGLKIGQNIQLSHNGSYTDQFGIPRFRQESSAIKTTVIELYRDSAVLQTFDSLPASNIQLNDFANIQ
ncbi:flagella assembly protein FlgT [Motilimonas cestriensis]|uniref:Flagella assembly protein FlgT n=1 Tax=Motilimonas cestriensis TaxID=2742685 RepID=A0ABS8WBZ1_9GAMM|nr:flagellar assembly protein T N-terminal domain-containing protein [Motilimonas cestriensis]MCE2595617.1 flagella assembly protein FlgT [Motilimonas cestriensis]